MKIKDGDLYSYATVNFNSHGFIIGTHEEYSYKVSVSDYLGVELQVFGGASGRNPSVPEDRIEQLVWDDRNRDGGASTFIFVYRSGKSKKQVLDMLKGPVEEHLKKLVQSYGKLVKNAEEMLSACRDKLPEEHICKPG